MVHNGTLRLYDYNLTELQSEALSTASKFFHNFINKVLLDNNGIVDNQFAKLVKSLSNLEKFQSIIYRNNDFGMESAEAMGALLKKKFPNNLDELRIVNCRMAHHVSEYLMDTLLDASFLRSLTLINANLNDRSMKLICDFMDSNVYLQDLDLSWNKLHPTSWMPFLQQLKSNRRLRSLSLSWNQLFKVKKFAHWDLEEKIQNRSKKALY